MKSALKHKFILATIILCLAPYLRGQSASYLFCVQSDQFPTFRAQVDFMAVDFGENAARQMVARRVDLHLKGAYEILVFDPETCHCEEDCPLLKVSSKDFKGDPQEAEASTFMGSAAESIDMLIFNAKELFNDPGGFIKRAFKGSKA